MTQSNDPFNKRRVALTDAQMLRFLHSQGISDANCVTLQQLNEQPESANINSIIFTGDTANEYNTLPAKEVHSAGGTYKSPAHPLTHHWMACHGDNVFDSYGFQSDYKWPMSMNFVRNHPSRLQEYNSDVCGEYCCRFLFYCNKERDSGSNSASSLGRDFSHYAGFGSDLFENDKIVLDWYNDKSTA
jgi:hypothetical protein